MSVDKGLFRKQTLLPARRILEHSARSGAAGTTLRTANRLIGIVLSRRPRRAPTQGVRKVAKPPTAKPPSAKTPVAKPPLAKPPLAKPPLAKPPLAKASAH